jgi:2-keto-3-deoxy-L-rhamnonate aldolase RhmA
MNNAKIFRDKLANGQTCFGTGISLSDPGATEALAGDLDMFWIDMEHTALSLDAVRHHLMAIKGSEAAALVRVPWNDPVLIKPVLDIGADGVIVPMVQTAEDVARAVAACRYPPLGIRGFGPLRPLDYGRRNVKEVCRAADETIIVTVQIEQAAAVENIDAILAVEGLTSIAFGPNDLAASLGYPMQPQHPAVFEVIQSVTDKARAAGVAVGISVGANLELLCKLVDIGVQWLSIGVDVTLLRRAAGELTDCIRGHIANE